MAIHATGDVTEAWRQHFQDIRAAVGREELQHRQDPHPDGEAGQPQPPPGQPSTGTNHEQDEGRDHEQQR